MENKEVLCVPDDKMYLSNPPQHRCKYCGKFWYTKDGIPACDKQPLERIPEEDIDISIGGDLFRMERMDNNEMWVAIYSGDKRNCYFLGVKNGNIVCNQAEDELPNQIKKGTEEAPTNGEETKSQSGERDYLWGKLCDWAIAYASYCREDDNCPVQSEVDEFRDEIDIILARMLSESKKEGRLEIKNEILELEDIDVNQEGDMEKKFKDIAERYYDDGSFVDIDSLVDFIKRLLEIREMVAYSDGYKKGIDRVLSERSFSKEELEYIKFITKIDRLLSLDQD